LDRVTVGRERFREVVVETEDGPELQLLCNKGVKCGYRDHFTDACGPISCFGELFECFEGKSKKERVKERAEEIAKDLGDD